jgi:endonuclease/exonuclease/phosphatase (EEP) superfamily protein YafD
VRWLARVAVALSVLVAVGLTGLYHAAPPRLWWVELARYLPFLVYVVPGFGALVLSWMLGWGWRLGAAGALALMMTAVMDVSFGLGRAPAPVDATAEAEAVHRVRFMTYNIKSYRAVHRWGGFVELTNEIAQHRPDVLVMQDAREVSRYGDLPYGMKDALPRHQVYAYGQYAVVSRYPLRGCRPADMSYRGEKHEYVRCTLDIDGTLVDVVTAHLLTPREGLNATRHEWLQGIDDWKVNFADRLAQADRIVSDLVPMRRPTLVAGDLNAPEHSIVVRTLKGAGLRDVHSVAGRGWDHSYGHTLKPGVSFLRIDHILASEEIGVSDAWVGWRRGSEHRPVIADLVIPRQPGTRP